MKLISFLIPAYNAEDYLEKCVLSLMPENEENEIIIVNDGSKDSTLEIALKLQSKYPHTIKIIDKENGGHGSTINEGVKVAKGLYFKVVDADDWLDKDSLSTLIDKIHQNKTNNIIPDLYITDFVYEHTIELQSYVRSYVDVFFENKQFSWHEMKKPFKYSNTLLMHSLLYQTQVLRESKLYLPHHTFYVDNIYAYQPLPFAKKIFYMNLPLYRYQIGREDQSVSFKNISARYEQQISVYKLLISYYEYKHLKKFPKNLTRYLKHNLNVLMSVTQLFIAGKNESIRKYALKKLWLHIKEKDKSMYYFLKYRSYSTLVNFFPWSIKNRLLRQGYKYFRNKLKLG